MSSMSSPPPEPRPSAQHASGSAAPARRQAPRRPVHRVPPVPVQVSAVALVDDLRRPTRVLAARRTEPPALAGGWEFPGGKLEPGEESRDAAVREALEELGVRVRLGERVGPGPWPLSGRVVMDLWWAVAEPGEPPVAPLQDHDQLRWLGAADLFDVAWLPADRPIVEHLAGLLRTP